jgi:hypothetical protein
MKQELLHEDASSRVHKPDPRGLDDQELPFDCVDGSHEPLARDEEPGTLRLDHPNSAPVHLQCCDLTSGANPDERLSAADEISRIGEVSSV